MSRPLTDLFPVGPQTRLDPEFFNGLIRELEARVGELQVLKQGLEAAIGLAQEIALARVNEIISPAQAELSEKLEAAQVALDATEALLADLSDDQFTIAQIAGLQTALDGKSATGHGHAIGQVSGLQNALDGKASSAHSHSISQVSGLNDALSEKATSGDLATEAYRLRLFARWRGA